MQHYRIFIIVIGLLVFLGCSEQHSATDQHSSIFAKGRKIDNDNFNGIGWVTMLAEPDSLNPMYAGHVLFEPGTRTNWHSHPSGQILIVTSGQGYYQEMGKNKRVLQKGDAVKCPPDTPHWHGASPTSEFSHIAVSSREKGSTRWLTPVSDDEYSN